MQTSRSAPEPEMQVIVVVPEVLHDRRAAPQPQDRAGEDDVRPGDASGPGGEPLRAAGVEPGALVRRHLGAGAARVVDVDVEAVLVRRVALAAELRAERPAARAREIADH